MVLPVVDAITRADTKYAQGVIDRRNAEQELTADIIANARLRLDAERDYAGQVVKAYQTIRPHRRERKARDRLDNPIEFERPQGAWLHHVGQS